MPLAAMSSVSRVSVKKPVKSVIFNNFVAKAAKVCKW
jgi:hypothetical protein